ncbi:MAG: RNA polymerase sigma factor [Alphaproteobacteria bacterium]|nr:RNA polymerase sigma factor [Alphaproteobacteria bacterium]
MDDLDDEQLITRARKGDIKAFEALVNKHYETMFKMAFKWCRNKSDAEDITQDACIKLARGLDGFKGKSAFTSWLYRLVINAGKDWYKKQNRHPSNPDALEKVSAKNKSDEQVYAQQVLDAVNKLPDGEKEALLLVMSEGLSHKEAAKALGCKESTISWRIHEARKKLNAQFNKEQKYG